PADALDAVQDAFPEHAERISATVVLLAFRSAVGKYTLPGFGEIELVSCKWNADHFDNMLRDLTDVAAALPFSRRVGSGLPYERVCLPELSVPYHAFVYLRYALSEFAPADDRLDLALRRVLSRPHQRLVAGTRLVPVERARAVGTRGLLRALTSPWEWREMPEGDGGAIAAALQGHLPERIEEEQRHHSVDTPENRFVRAVLELANTIIEGTRQQVESWSQPGLRQRVLQDCAEMARVLAPLRAHAMWREVGPMVQYPAGSPVLQRRYGYREVLRHFVRLRLISRIPLEYQAVEDLLSLKDIATLYELWSFFAVVRAVESCIGPPSEADAPAVTHDQIVARWGLRVGWANGAEVLYNARFARGPSRLSTSVPLRPDVCVRIPSGPNRGLHLFDAKFRLESLASLDEEDDDSATFKRADLYKMHTYRDAIPDATSVWIIYPGTEQRFYPADPAAIQRAYSGVGAVPARPDGGALELVVRELFGAPAVSTARAVTEAPLRRAYSHGA
ncbi:MAG TPA: DUF2357 domain-containing protein, partial [Anaeromyxobacteraceae bacterium]|nr:DUF2357 domain-containing protein [Anaeromyxobacteraceae bacterium]